MKRLLVALLWLLLLASGASAKWEGLTKLPEGCNAVSTPVYKFTGASLQGIGFCPSDKMLYVALQYDAAGLEADFGNPVFYENAPQHLLNLAKTMAVIVPKSRAVIIVYPPGKANFSGDEIGAYRIENGQAISTVLVNQDLQRKNELRP